MCEEETAGDSDEVFEIIMRSRVLRPACVGKSTSCVRLYAVSSERNWVVLLLHKSFT